LRSRFAILDPLGVGSSESEQSAPPDKTEVCTQMLKPIDDHFLFRYRELLDAEDGTFDELEHAAEDGDHARFDAQMAAWQHALKAKLTWLSACGYDVAVPSL
jgi:hypothetical protein